MNERGRRLRSLIQARDILVMPGVHDALSAQIFAAAGFQAVQCSSWGLAAAAGLPEGGVHSFADNREAVRRIVRAVDLPVNADIEDGYGGPRAIETAIRELILVGAAGTNLEDRAARNAPSEPIRILPLDDMLEKLAAVARARKALGSEFVLNARTDALIVRGADPAAALEEAIRRGRAYAAAGADLIFCWGAKTPEQIQALVRGIDHPVAISAETAPLTVAELQALGVARVSFGTASVEVAAAAVQELAAAILREGSTRSLAGRLAAVDIPALVQKHLA